MRLSIAIVCHPEAAMLCGGRRIYVVNGNTGSLRSTAEMLRSAQHDSASKRDF